MRKVKHRTRQGGASQVTVVERSPAGPALLRASARSKQEIDAEGARGGEGGERVRRWMRGDSEGDAKGAVEGEQLTSTARKQKHVYAATAAAWDSQATDEWLSE